MLLRGLFKSHIILGVMVLCFMELSCGSKPKYQDSRLSFEERVDDLVSRMTLEEKVSQLVYNSPSIPRLGIPEYNWWNECLHGVGRAGIATVFPQAIGMAAMWDDYTLYNIATMISDEARAKYHDFIKKDKRGIYHGLTFWSPNINIFRDPRWGRGMETYGEDPYLTGELGVAFIKGLQGDHPKYYKLIATAKHFVVHSGPESSRHRFNANPDYYDFLETYSPHFKKAVQTGKVYSVMCAYNRFQGHPCCGHPGLDSLLRNVWGFNGYIVSDCWAISDFYTEKAHEIVNTRAEASAIALKSGTDLNCGDSYPSLVEAVKKGYISEKDIDIALKRILLARMKLGMFDSDKEVPYTSIPYSVVDSEKHRQMALEAARKSMVLLENKNGILPLSKNLKTGAVIGPNADDPGILLGNYNGYSSKIVTPFQGIKQKLIGAEVHYAPGCSHAEGFPLLAKIPSGVLFADSEKTVKGLYAEYFDNTAFSGKPAYSRQDEDISFTWWDKGPGAPLNGDKFGVRWTGVLVPRATGNHAIGFEGYPKVKFWIENGETKEFSSVHHSQKQYEYFFLEKGKSYPIKIEYTQDNSDYAHFILFWDEPAKNLKQEALDLAAKSDLVVLCMGLSPMLEGEEMPVKVNGFSQGDRDDIKLPEIQTDLIKSIHKLGKPTILVLLNGSALAFNWESKNIPAIIEAWYPGQAGGTAIADVIFGDYNPAGRLPVTFYKSVDQLPDFSDYNMAGRTYRYFAGEPLYEFGYGLSYTTFKYSNLQMVSELQAGDDLIIEIDVTNTGKIGGEEVAQLYISHPDSKFKVPIRALKGFKRIFLQPGETKKISFNLSPADMAVLNEKNQYVIEGAGLQVSVGGRQPGVKPLNDGVVVQKEVKINTGNKEYLQID
jgi:beta-glucosidase